jgi:hypothetical protein
VVVVVVSYISETVILSLCPTIEWERNNNISYSGLPISSPEWIASIRGLGYHASDAKGVICGWEARTYSKLLHQWHIDYRAGFSLGAAKLALRYDLSFAARVLAPPSPNRLHKVRTTRYASLVLGSSGPWPGAEFRFPPRLQVAPMSSAGYLLPSGPCALLGSVMSCSQRVPSIVRAGGLDLVVPRVSMTLMVMGAQGCTEARGR